MVTDPVQISIDVDYQVHGFTADFTPSGGSATEVLVIDNMNDTIFAMDAGDKPGAIALKPRVNIRVQDLAAAPEGATLTLTDERWLDHRNTTWAVKASTRINRYERELELGKTAP
jgi:hypothetical protein